MEKRHYELLFITRHVSEDKAENYFADYLAVFKKDGEVLRYENWGIRDLAYRIDDVSRGAYILANIYCLPKVIEEIEKRCKFDEMILRYMVIRMNEGITEDSPIKKFQALKQEHKREDETRSAAGRIQAKAADKAPQSQNSDQDSQNAEDAKEEKEAAPAPAEESKDQPAAVDSESSDTDVAPENVKANDDNDAEVNEVPEVNTEEQKTEATDDLAQADMPDSAKDDAEDNSEDDSASPEAEENK